MDQSSTKIKPSKMKKLLLIPIVAVVTGCSTMSKFDNNEYAILNSITTTAEVAKFHCAHVQEAGPYIDGLYVRTVELKNYSKNTANNEHIADSSVKLLEIVQEFRDRKNSKDGFSKAYCEIKMDLIRSVSTSIQSVAGHKGR